MTNSATALPLFLVTIFTLPYFSEQQQSKYFTCTSKEKCDDCIKSFGCVWCAAPDFTERRCQRQGESKCDAKYLMDPKIEAFATVATPLTDVKPRGSGSNSYASSQENVVQVSPQHYYLKLRPNEGNPYRIQMYYRQAVDYPIDLYYLMDLSNSMRDDKEKLSALGDTLGKTMSNLTSNFRLGFGSFVDKVVMPYVSIVPKKLEHPCVDDLTQCIPPYGFHNHLSLCSNTQYFVVSYNL